MLCLLLLGFSAALVRDAVAEQPAAEPEVNYVVSLRMTEGPNDDKLLLMLVSAPGKFELLFPEPSVEFTGTFKLSATGRIHLTYSIGMSELETIQTDDGEAVREKEVARVSGTVFLRNGQEIPALRSGVGGGGLFIRIERYEDDEHE